jgi:hypothetical protein
MIETKRYRIEWVTPFGRQVIGWAGQGDSVDYVHRRARELSQGWQGCYTRVVDTGTVPETITVYQYGKEVKPHEPA